MEKNICGAVSSEFALLWAEPLVEEYEKNSLLLTADAQAWVESLDVAQRLWLVERVKTTALYGERLIILEQQGEWLKVALPFQLTDRNKQGYVGWILAKQVIQNPIYVKEQETLPEIVIATSRATLFADAELSKPLTTLSYQARLPLLKTTGKYLQIRTPDGQKAYLSLNVAKQGKNLSFNREKLVHEAKRFLDLAYLWGGTSAFGFDCSGFVFRLYQSQGYLIPRDSSEQATKGRMVVQADLWPGDLLFFATNQGKEKIHHVAMYLGEGLMIHSPNSKSVIRIEAMDNGIYGIEYWGARRLVE